MNLDSTVENIWQRYSPRAPVGLFIVALLVLVFGFWVLAPVILLVFNSFNVAEIGQPYDFSLNNWSIAFSEPAIFSAIGNTLFVFVLYTGIGFPIAVLIAWALARTKMPFSHGLEFLFWVSFVMPAMATTMGWIFLLDPRMGLLNRLAEALPFIDQGPFNIYGLPGIVWAHLMGNGISQKVMLLTPAFRNMDLALEEAAAVSGASKLRAMMRVTLPVMMPAMLLVFLLNFVRLFQSFEIEQLLGKAVGFFVYSTLIYEMVRVNFPPLYGQATALASVTLIIIAIIVPLQRWMLARRRYTTVTGQFRLGLIDLGWAQPMVIAVIVGVASLLTIVPAITLLGGSFMTRVGIFAATPTFTVSHWIDALQIGEFLDAARTTFVLSATTAVVSPLVFSMIAYVIVRTRWPGRTLLDYVFWTSSAIPGMLSGLGLLWLFLGTPILAPLYGTIYALVLVVIMQGKLLSTQISKGTILQVGADLEEQARVSGAGWLRTYFKVWIPLVMPTLVMMGIFNFTLAASTTSSIILLAAEETQTISILILTMMSDPSTVELEKAGIYSLTMIAMTAGVAIVARTFGIGFGVQHR